MKNTIKICAALFLVSCQSQKIDRRIYSPDVLIIPPNTSVITTEGIFISGPEKSVWHSAKRYEELENKLSQF